MKLRHLALAFSMAAVASQAQAVDQYIFGFSEFNAGNHLTTGTTDVPFVDSGWYDVSGTHNSGNTNYIVGPCTTCSGQLFNNWFVADISNVSGPVSSLSLTLFSYKITLSAGNYYLYDYGGSIDALVAGGSGLVGTYNDLGSGVFFGSRFYTRDTDSDTFHTINLNSAAVADFNNALARGAKQWALGGTFAPGTVVIPDPTPGIPEPETYAMLLAGLGLLGFMARRRKQHTA